MKFITAEQIEQAAGYPELVEVLRTAFRSEIVTPKRHHHQVANPPSAEATLLLMPGWEAGQNLGVKVVSVFPENGRQGLPSIHGVYVLMDGKTGQVKCLLDGKALTTKRTAAASALAAEYLSNKADKTLLMVGTGALAPDLIRAHAAVRPISKVFIWGRNFEKARQTADGFQQEKFSVQAVRELKTVIPEADIISCATLSTDPLIPGEALRPGQHLDLVGSFKKNMREADDAAIRRAEIYVDTFAALDESGDLAIPIQNGIIQADGIRADLSRLCREAHPGRASEAAVTLFKSVGHASEDLAAATYFYHKIFG